MTPPLTNHSPYQRIACTPAARRDLRRLDPPVRERVIGALDQLARTTRVRTYASSPEPTSTPLRVGDSVPARDVDSRQIVVLRVLPRGRVYER